MNVRIKGSHELFRGICQHARIEGEKTISKANSIDEISNSLDEIMNDLMDILHFNYGYWKVSVEDVEVFPDCDLEGELLEEAVEDCDGDEEYFAIIKYGMAIEQLAEEILGRIADERLQKIKSETEVA
jgi:hypothetical protein